MRSRCVPLLFFLLLFACSHGQIATLPQVDAVENSAEIYIIRPSHFLGSAVSYKISLDDQDIVLLKNNSYTKFYAIPGSHNLSCRSYQFLVGWVGDTHEFEFASKQKYVLLLNQNFGHFTFTMLEEPETQKYLKEAEPVLLNQ